MRASRASEAIRLLCLLHPKDPGEVLDGYERQLREAIEPRELSDEEPEVVRAKLSALRFGAAPACGPVCG